jgi:cation transport ATPase
VTSRQIELEIAGLSGAESLQRLKETLCHNTGVEAVHVQPDTGRATVHAHANVVLEHLLESVEQAGFMARPARLEDD